MNILIAYATFSSGTGTASHIVEKILTDKGHAVTRQLVDDSTPDTFSNFDLVILASPSWEHEGKDGQPHPAFASIIQTSVQTPDTRYAIFGLGDSTYARFCGAVDHLENYVRQMKGQLITDSLRIDGFYFDEEKNTQKLIDWTQKLDTALTS